MTISAMPKSSRMFFVLSMMLLLSGCATVMLQYKVDPSRSFTHTGTAPLDYVSFNESHVYVATGNQLYRFDRLPGSHDLVVRRMQDSWIATIDVRREGLGEYRANFVLADPAGVEEPQSQLLKRGKQLSHTPINMEMLPLAGVETVDLYTEKRRSIAKRGGYRVVALAAGVGIDHLIISQSWSGGAKVFAELATGYAIGCWGEDPRRSTLC
jgi:hypothetical protein